MRCTTVRDATATDVVTVTQATPHKELPRRLAGRRISAVPVIDDGGAPAAVGPRTDLLAGEADPQPRPAVPFDQMCQIDPPVACTACAPGVTGPSQCPKPFLLDDDQLAEVARRWAKVRAAHRPAPETGVG